MRLAVFCSLLALGAASPGHALTIRSVTPASGSVLGDTQVIISVAGLNAASGVTVNMPTPATIISATNSTVTVRTPPNGPGLVNVEVFDNAGNRNAKLNAFEYLDAPTISRINPATGATVGGNRISFTGLGFAPGNVQVHFGEALATDVIVSADGKGLYCTTPPGPAGPVTVTVTNLGSGSVTTDFTYQALAITSISPGQGPAVSNTEVALYGTGFSPTQTVLFGNAPATITDLTPTAIVVESPYTQHPGIVDVTVRNTDGSTYTLPSGFAYRQSRPRFELTGPLPSSGKIWVSLQGTELDYRNPKILFGRTPALDYSFSCDLTAQYQLCCLVPPGTPGPVDVTFIGADGGKFTLAGQVDYGPSPGNDECAAAYPLSFDEPMYFDFAFANMESAACPFGQAAASVWYRFTPPQDGYLDVVAPVDEHVIVDLLSECCGKPLVTPEGCSFPAACLSNVPVTGCVDYLVRVLSAEPYFLRYIGPQYITAAFRPVPGSAPCTAEGEGEGEGTSTPTENTVDADHDGRISLSELLRLVQFYRLGIGCGADTEDGYAPGSADHTCAPYSADYNPRDWQISLSEALRAIQLYSAGAYHPCPEGEDGFCPGP